jgi:hypothetical protein
MNVIFSSYSELWLFLLLLNVETVKYAHLVSSQEVTKGAGVVVIPKHGDRLAWNPSNTTYILVRDNKSTTSSKGFTVRFITASRGSGVYIICGNVNHNKGWDLKTSQG